jgi:hypothetical protein
MSGPAAPPPSAPRLALNCPTEFVYHEFSRALSDGNPFDVQVGPLLSIVLPSVILPLLLLLLDFGRVLVRASFTLIGLGAGAVVSLFLLYSGGSYTFLCEAATAIVIGMALVCALVAASTVRLATFALGFLCGEAIALTVFMVAPALGGFTLGTPTSFGYALFPVWTAFGVVGLGFGAISMRYRSLTAIIITSILGGYGVPFGVRILTQGSLPQWAHAAIFAGCALGGAGFQLFMDRRQLASVRARARRKARSAASRSRSRLRSRTRPAAAKSAQVPELNLSA